MLAYIVRRLLLIIPTLFGILLINFIIIQAAPGGPVEQMIAKLEGFEGATSRIAGGGAEVSVAGSSSYRGAQGLDPALIKEIERMYGFDKSARNACGSWSRTTPGWTLATASSATPRSST
jgi:microcin C transport system permease protein